MEIETRFFGTWPRGWAYRLFPNGAWMGSAETEQEARADARQAMSDRHSLRPDWQLEPLG